MKRNKITKILFIAIISLILLSIIFLSLGNTVKNLNIAKQVEPKKMEENYYISKISNNEDMCYLSDIKYDEENSKVEWGSITLDSNLENQYNNGLITLIVNQKKTHF